MRAVERRRTRIPRTVRPLIDKSRERDEGFVCARSTVLDNARPLMRAPLARSTGRLPSQVRRADAAGRIPSQSRAPLLMSPQPALGHVRPPRTKTA